MVSQLDFAACADFEASVATKPANLYCGLHKGLKHGYILSQEFSLVILWKIYLYLGNGVYQCLTKGEV